MFSIVDAMVLQPLPFAEPERLAMLWETRLDREYRNKVVSGGELRRLAGAQQYSEIRSGGQSVGRMLGLPGRRSA